MPLAGQPMLYLKRGSSGVKASLYGTSLSFDLVVTPFFEADVLPTADRFFVPFPGLVNRVEAKPQLDIEDTEIAARLRRSVAGFDVTVYAFRQFYRISSMQPDSPTAPTIMPHEAESPVPALLRSSVSLRHSRALLH